MPRFLLLLVTCLLMQGCIVISPFNFGRYDYSIVTLEAGNRDKILVIDIDGTITGGTVTGNSLVGFDDSTVNQVAEKLDKARHDRNVKAILLRIDSPGGGVTASDIVYDMLVQFKEDEGIPIYASMVDLAASGGYYIAMAADKVYAHPTTITGSIGVIALFPQFGELGEKVGFRMEAITSAEHKDMGSPFKKMSTTDRQIFQDMIDHLYARFVEVVGEGRPELTEDRIRELADGRVYTAEQAREYGLIDGVQYLEDVVQIIRKEIASPKASVVLYRRTAIDSYDSLYAKSPMPERRANGSAGGNSVNLLNIDAGSMADWKGPVFQYMWMP